ncbi:hypothetical protein IEQ34_024439 [Dendrobium chrysotoxum]|uniref:Uncharacterized protein n=1 Tax=Dendrobium chrysotoxum TaxID=161865 RepID=A0AAV7FTQ0_DENCH|nr:hypothetical protein IEQ34_024439 [Dendrobium chrysotoxum]
MVTYRSTKPLPVGLGILSWCNDRCQAALLQIKAREPLICKLDRHDIRFTTPESRETFLMLY